MTIGELIEELKKYPGDAKVYFELGHTYPTDLNSWRGSYDEPALGYSCDETPLTAQEMINGLEYALTIHHEGWKGGFYTYTRDHELWVDNPGEYSRTKLDGADYDEDMNEIYLRVSKA